MSHAVFAVHSFVSAAPSVSTDLGGLTGANVATPILNGAEILIPAAVAVSGIHKLMEHRETAGSLVIELLTKGGGAILAVELVKLLVH